MLSRTGLLQAGCLLRAASWRTSACLPDAWPKHAGQKRAQTTTSSSPFHDDVHANGIFYHALTSSGDRYALSYSSKVPSSAEQPSVLGILSLPSSAQITAQDGSRLAPSQLAQSHAEDFVTNPNFHSFLHSVLKLAALDDGMIQYEAFLRKSGFAHVADQREQLMPGRIPYPENILASIGFDNQELVGETYSPNEVHRIITKELGVMVLRPAWHARLMEELDKA
ncbi:hypothetical protein CBOM_02486 [Ceraceosorus bombacis]|uniref:Uncharacterized protein n=1 Tax=Ceraceosorus bombacis TaxID=401625 RepID=A0A0P1BGK1_9BASI|nr:hypothetical protein CBOM_02486 [Ceraceosorus bombacis]